MPLSLRSDRLEQVVFLDRDGVINRDSPAYVKSTSEFTFLPRSLKALQKLTANHFKTIIVTNQSAINRGMITRETLTGIHTAMLADIRALGGEINDVYFCPHTPQEACGCRKPAPGMILQAQKTHGIDLTSACMVGDSAKDIECARRAGVQYALLVKTGDYNKARRDLSAKGIQPDAVTRDLFEAVDWIVSKFRGK